MKGNQLFNEVKEKMENLLFTACLLRMFCVICFHMYTVYISMLIKIYLYVVKMNILDVVH